MGSIRFEPPLLGEVSDKAQWANTQNMANWTLGRGGTVVFCMWDSNRNDLKQDGHGDGKVDDMVAARNMWRTVGGVAPGRGSTFRT